MHIGPFALTNRLMVAPMAGVTDRPFRQLCKQWGAGYAVSEMITSKRDLWHTVKTTRRADHRRHAVFPPTVGRTHFHRDAGNAFGQDG